MGRKNEFERKCAGMDTGLKVGAVRTQSIKQKDRKKT